MIWWKGGGLWMGMLVALCIVSAGKAFGSLGPSVGLFSAAGMVLVARNWVDEDSSLYSLPVRYWPWVLGVLSVLCFFSR